jgi:hypothetical protein
MGTKFCWGTGGDSGAALAGLAAVFNNPQTFDCLPYVHNFTPSGDTVLTGFFIPAYRMHFDYLDDRGVTNTEKAKAYFLAQRDKKQVNP